MARTKYSAGDRKERDDFTPEEGKLILSLAREAEPHIYWVSWVCSFLGTRTSEVADASTLDIECIDGIWVMSIHQGAHAGYGKAVVRDTEGGGRSYPEPARGFCKSPIDLNYPRRVSSSIWLRRSTRSAANTFRSSRPDCRDGTHPTPQTGCSIKSKVGYRREIGENKKIC
jgi:hypothetical protein